jgi:histone-lysine N-methyltransferase ASH1L
MLQCYYLMSFDQNMILDGTKGSIARFVNHSCKPNCRMVKWLVAGKPRMALFAGDSPIMTGDELTYDYNFDPFSAKNIQACRCGSDNCRGVLGPKPKDPKTVKETIKDAVKATKKLAKRKFKEALGVRDDDDSDPAPSPKKRKIKAPTTLKRSKSAASMKVVAKDAVKSVRKSVSSQILNARSKVVTVKRETVTTTKTKTKKTYKVNSVRTYGSSRRSKVTPRRSRAMTLASLGTPEKMASVGKRLTKPTTKRKEDNMVHLDTIVAIARSGSSATYKSPYAPVSAPVTPSKESTIRVVRSPLEDMEVDDTVDDDGTIEVDDSMEVDDTEDEM